MIAWALYTLAISAALGLAALALERALDLYRGPIRLPWVAAMVGSIAVPAALLVVPRAGPTAAVDVAPPVAIEAPVATADRLPDTPLRAWPDLGPYLLAGWGLASLVLLLIFARSAWSLRRARRRWRPLEIAGQPVLESDGVGPAVVGVVRTRIAVPTWIRELDEDLQALVLAHERSHQAASDPLLLWLGVATCVGVPWCAPLWWQLRRLRIAIEVDCDRRVLAGGASLARYGSLLLEVGRRSGGRPFALVGLFEPRSFLERRIRVMTANTPGARLLRTARALLVVGILGVLATRAPLPPAPDLAWGQQADDSDEAGIDRDTTGFTFTPYDVKPRCLSGCDEEDIVRHFQAVEGGECRVTIGIRIDRDGRVIDTEMLRRAAPLSCQSSADAWARGTTWSPAFWKGEKVVAWIARPVTYVARGEGAPEVAPGGLPERSIAPVDTPPRFERTAFDERPVCVENCRADAILSTLKEAGPIAGHCEAVIGIRIDTDGRVTATDLLKTEGQCVDAGLRRWAESTRWKPARRNGEPVVVWIAQPLTTSVDPDAEETGGGGAHPGEAETDPDAIAKTELRRAMTVQEMYRAENDEYGDAFELGLSPPETITLEIRSDGEGYVMVARHDDGTVHFCASSETRAIVEGTDC